MPVPRRGVTATLEGVTSTSQGGHCHITGGSLTHYRGGTATLEGGHCHITGGSLGLT